MAESEVSQSRSFKGVPCAARIIFLLPAAALTVFMLGMIVYGLATGIEAAASWVKILWNGAYLSLPLLGLGLLPWKWPRAGGILLILMAAGSFSLAGHDGSFILESVLLMGAAFLIGGILHLIVSPWGRRLWYISK